MCELNINLRPNENLYVTTYEDGEVEYIPCTPDEHEKEENGGIVSTLYSSYTMEKLKTIKSVEVDKIKVKGKEELITIYKPK